MHVLIQAVNESMQYVWLAIGLHTFDISVHAVQPKEFKLELSVQGSSA